MGIVEKCCRAVLVAGSYRDVLQPECGHNLRGGRGPVYTMQVLGHISYSIGTTPESIEVAALPDHDIKTVLGSFRSSICHVVL